MSDGYTVAVSDLVYDQYGQAYLTWTPLYSSSYQPTQRELAQLRHSGRLVRVFTDDSWEALPLTDISYNWQWNPFDQAHKLRRQTP